ncbi:MAG: hypothetical protein KF833_03005 [Verrucomicrobiae bacterium]|nr:hypothetical protein [Verrucomicrobiae bacterium]
MGLFRRKQNPLDQRAQSLNRRIAELQAEIAKLNRNLAPEKDPKGSAKSSAPPQRPANPSHDPVFERIPPRPLEPRPADAPGREAVELGLRRPVWGQWWRRFKGQIVDPPPSNEKLVSYLAAGSIQGLRPLRYERRVARNRIIFVCVVLGLLLWGLLIVFWQTR